MLPGLLDLGEHLQPAPFRASFRLLLCPTQNSSQQAFDSSSLHAIKILPQACTELFSQATGPKLCAVFAAISPDQALQGGLLGGVMMAVVGVGSQDFGFSMPE